VVGSNSCLVLGAELSFLWILLYPMYPAIPNIAPSTQISINGQAGMIDKATNKKTAFPVTAAPIPAEIPVVIAAPEMPGAT